MRSYLIIFAVIVIPFGCSNDERTYCNTNDDCFRGEVCNLSEKACYPRDASTTDLGAPPEDMEMMVVRDLVVVDDGLDMGLDLSDGVVEMDVVEMDVVDMVAMDMDPACGSCLAGEICLEGSCVAACNQASAECGEQMWSGLIAQCGACAAGAGCFRNACMTGLASGWRDVAAGEDFTCATRADETVWCWGDNTKKQLSGASARQLVPTQVSGLGGIIDLSIANKHTCALDSSQRVWCWGLNNNSQVGDSSTMDQGTPVQVDLSGALVTEVAASLWHTCVALTSGKTRCWGFNGQGQLGDDSTSASVRPVEAKGLSATHQLAAGLTHTCAVQRDGSAWCWGNNGAYPRSGRLGQGESGASLTSSAIPSKVVGLDGERVRQVVAGNGHSCALLQSGQVRCWGDNTYGQLGDDSLVASTSPVVVAGLNSVIQIAAGWEHTCAVLASRSVKCWGRNDAGQLGDGSKNMRPEPVFATGLTDVVALGLGYYHSCAVQRDGKLYCWGKNTTGQLGDGSTFERLTPTPIP
jgi:hypothetical protein